MPYFAFVRGSWNSLFRLDAVAFLWKQSGTSCVHLEQTHELVKLIRLLLEHMNPDAVVIADETYQIGKI